ncbi:MAG: hypothetical protein ACR2PX_03760 [Endozoicomonas sp.]|uniref:hypothetical protein n=1 Tax=Endozoicomonas sp. TaxID=1892382 RepID=UPI003D9B555C
MTIKQWLLALFFSCTVTTKLQAYLLLTPGNESVDSWSQAQFKKLQKLRQQGNNHPFLRLYLKPDQIGYYVAFQKLIAEELPEEIDRPGIWLSVRQKYLKRPQSNLAIIGGMGPLADADLTRRVVLKLNERKDFSWQSSGLEVLSMPPPRRVKHWRYSCKYFYKLISFGESPFLGQGNFDRYALASNTAHQYAKMVGVLVFNFAEFINLVERNTRRLKSLNPQGALILGTSQAASSQLYKPYLAAYNIPFAMPRRQSLFQHMIYEAKSGALVDPKLFHRAVFDEVRWLSENQFNVSHVFLACTELSLIKTEDSYRVLQEHDLILIDSQVLFSEHLSDELYQLDFNRQQQQKLLENEMMSY